MRPAKGSLRSQSALPAFRRILTIWLSFVLVLFTLLHTGSHYQAFAAQSDYQIVNASDDGRDDPIQSAAVDKCLGCSGYSAPVLAVVGALTTAAAPVHELLLKGLAGQNPGSDSPPPKSLI